MTHGTRSSSGISKPKKNDSVNVADPAIPPPQSQVRRSNRSSAASKAWETRRVKQAAAATQPEPRTMESASTESTAVAVHPVSIEDRTASPETQLPPNQDKPTCLKTTRARYPTIPFTIHERYKGSTKETVPNCENITPSVQINGVPLLPEATEESPLSTPSSVFTEGQLEELPRGVQMSSYQPCAQQPTLMLRAPDVGPDSSGWGDLTPPVLMNDRNRLSPALTQLSASSRQPSPLSFNSSYDDDSETTKSSGGLAQHNGVNSGSSRLSPFSQIDACEDTKEEKVGRPKTILRKDMKKDPQLNKVFEHIHADFYLHAITENLFIESAECRAVVQRLTDDTFRRSEIAPFDIPECIVNTLARDIKSWRCKLKKHLVTLVPAFYGVGPSADRNTVQENIQLALDNSNFLFRSYSADDSQVRQICPPVHTS
ncbi:uncharacterized protein EI90DRAFT_3022345 [Cantharellus anzutake]|uniref:uncharacterized protein n=1 Tax=Cantharellus anzutake TaxID=1750568 RepID=UPI0019038F53|nr:uncharacterized protein EI90DRAFT_3022345 [Cantharellus anzutake]KAF8314382.1 hypothetical protein EI90DRAFT_3022345 [Cantharellus anzutake]